MNITLTKLAQKALQTETIPEGQLPRLDAELTGGCGISLTYSLIVDEKRPMDTIIEINGITFQIDHFTKRYLDTETSLVIDYCADKGYFIEKYYQTNTCDVSDR
ncbi:iron-sulfur cluster biosynthesis family protein [Gracilibacillus salinarum]|uniref:Iron-sulfur cluster biosynthesis family protein n=1 Tax=Gracilibacillus salinarum TaxID=2932255 RepID=A0ABY4GJ75_9BACI|nr:iron-sulfur cluster biosynthesis family protein [Gracilibacillus salinarum]UOQ84050.1 iron-sulfur cluster biosynthesis family protein [Gracilibacillus salinarum]